MVTELGPSPPIRPGDLLAGKYRIERVLGAGGMGVVVAARHVELDEPVAVKFLHGAALDDPEATARFLREARAAVKIRSEHVARVIDVGRFDQGAPYMVMEYLHGQDLSAVLQRGPLAPEDAVDYVLQACEAMVEAHALGIVHRDLKPANLFLTHRSDGEALIKVLDFGISKLTSNGAPEAHITKTSAVMGSPYYMSPEQLRSAKEVDERTDIWSLGVILFELLTGQTPFRGDSLPVLLAAIMMEEPEGLRRLRPDLAEPLEEVVLRALRKDRAARYATVADLAAALAGFAPVRSRAVLEKMVRASSARPTAPPTSTDVTSGQPKATASPGSMTGGTWSKTGSGEAKRRRGGRWAVLAVAASVVAGALAWRAKGSGVEPRRALVTSSAGPAPVLASPRFSAESALTEATPTASSTMAPPPVRSASAPSPTRAPQLPKTSPPVTASRSAPLAAHSATTPPPSSVVPAPSPSLTAPRKRSLVIELK
jgi:eukaryotic-like serine/threonine-protein kinase